MNEAADAAYQVIELTPLHFGGGALLIAAGVMLILWLVKPRK